MNKKKKHNRRLHNIQRIAKIIALLQDEFDKFIDDETNGGTPKDWLEKSQ